VIEAKEIFTASLVLFAVIDIVGNIPLVISLREKVGNIQSETASIIAAIIMIGFFFINEEMLNLIGIDINSFAVAGSIVISFLALEMILGTSIFRNDVPETASIIPLAFPMIERAGTMTFVLSLRAEYHVLNIIFVYIILKSSKHIENFLGKSGINIIQKVFGIILLAIAVKLFTSNISQLS